MTFLYFVFAQAARLFALCLVLLCFIATPGLAGGEKRDAYPYNPHVPPGIWQTLEPYFLPADHPIKSRLDILFHQGRITESLHSFKKYGFGQPNMRKPANIVVGRNPWFNGFIFKVILDCQPTLCEWENWVHRIQGARAIRECIERHGFERFTVPRKWIYPLPAEPSPSDEHQSQRKNFILIAEDMHILSRSKNLDAFKTSIDQQLLQELHYILSEVGLLDSVYPDNIPFNKNGQIAFIDTEHHHHPPETIPYQKLSRHLSEEMKIYWQSLPFVSN